MGAPAFYSTVSQHVEKSVQNVTTSYESEYANVPVSRLPDDSSCNILLDRIPNYKLNWRLREELQHFGNARVQRKVRRDRGGLFHRPSAVLLNDPERWTR